VFFDRSGSPLSDSDSIDTSHVASPTRKRGRVAALGLAVAMAAPTVGLVSRLSAADAPAKPGDAGDDLGRSRPDGADAASRSAGAGPPALATITPARPRASSNRDDAWEEPSA